MGRAMDIEDLVRSLSGMSLPAPGSTTLVRRVTRVHFEIATVLEGSTAGRVRLEARGGEQFEAPLWRLRPAPPPEPEPEDQTHDEQRKRRRKSQSPCGSKARRRRSALDMLGIDSDTFKVGEAELRAAWRGRVLEVHPDKGGNESDFRAVQDAYNYLTAPSSMHR